MALTGLQEKAFDVAVNPTKKAHYIKGYAGTGKTVTIIEAANALGDSCAVLAPTNKAATNMREKGIKKAQTIHSMLYVPQEIEIPKRDKDNNIIYQKDSAGANLLDETGDPIPVIAEKRLGFALQEGDNITKPRIALVDESSMVDEKVAHDLMNAFEHVIFFGDDFQLPPVGGKDIFGNTPPDVFLDEVHRVALENPIIRYATAIRQDNEPSLASVICHEIKHCTPNNKHLYQSIVEHDVQCISWKNKTRHTVNDAIRKQKNLPANELIDGETIIANQNVYKMVAGEKELVLYNGQICTVEGNYKGNDDHFESIFVTLKGHKVPFWMWPFWNQNYFDLKDNNNAWYNELQRRKHGSGEKRPVYGDQFDYSYCLTAHKSQGSEFKNVAIFDERQDMVKGDMRAQRQRWFYTAVTRARERILIVKE